MFSRDATAEQVQGFSTNPGFPWKLSLTQCLWTHTVGATLYKSDSVYWGGVNGDPLVDFAPHVVEAPTKLGLNANWLRFVKQTPPLENNLKSPQIDYSTKLQLSTNRVMQTVAPWVNTAPRGIETKTSLAGR